MDQVFVSSAKNQRIICVNERCLLFLVKILLFQNRSGPRARIVPRQNAQKTVKYKQTTRHQHQQHHHHLESLKRPNQLVIQVSNFNLSLEQFENVMIASIRQLIFFLRTILATTRIQ